MMHKEMNDEQHAMKVVAETASLFMEITDPVRILRLLCQRALAVTAGETAAAYRYTAGESRELILTASAGSPMIPKKLSRSGELISFIEESGEAVILNKKKDSPFREILLSETYQSGIAIPLSAGKTRIAVLFINSGIPFRFSGGDLRRLSILTRTAAGAIHLRRNGSTSSRKSKTMEESR